MEEVAATVELSIAMVLAIHGGVKADQQGDRTHPHQTQLLDLLDLTADLETAH
jgi:hypothetical protein